MSDIIPHDDQHIDALVSRPVWEQRTEETNHEYAWFVKYAELGEARDVMRAARLCGVPVKLLRAAATKNAWDDRCHAYDAAVVSITKAIQPSEDEALAMQYAAGLIMMRLGIEKAKLLNPALLNAKDARELLQFGSEMVRRGAGVADLKVQHDVVQRVTEDLELLLGPEG